MRDSSKFQKKKPRLGPFRSASVVSFVFPFPTPFPFPLCLCVVNSSKEEKKKTDILLILSSVLYILIKIS